MNVGVEPSERTRLDGALAGVEGWLQPEEAWWLYQSARTARTSGAPLAVEIGAYKGRSAISLGLGLKERNGRVVSIDPHTLEPNQLDTFTSNVARAGVDQIVTPVVRLSHDARPLVRDGSVSVLFVDGSHEYEDVLLDIRDWTPALTDGAVVAFNDPYWEGVSRALRETAAVRRAGFRRPRWCINTLFFDYEPHAAWTLVDELRLARLRAYLRLGPRWVRFHERLSARRRVPYRLKMFNLRVGRIVFSLILRSIR
jgi:predicted O-methyltransferase YrrM